MPDEQLIQLISDILAVQATPDDSIDTLDAWDSLGHIRIISALEQKYSIEVEDQDIWELTSVAKINKYVIDRQ